jgi:hypothetical protein
VNQFLSTALKYADNGWRVFPLHSMVNGQCTCGLKCDSPGKHPRTKNGLKDASIDPAVIEAWWERWPDSNIGIATGSESDLWVLDVDNKRSIEVGHRLVGVGDHSIAELESEHEALPETRYVETGGGGRHYYFSFGGGCAGNRANIRPGIDIRGEGGYVVAPPSIHVSGHVYRSENEDLLPVPPPAYLVEIASATATDASLIGFDDQVGEGGRNAFLHDLGARYRREYGFGDFQIYGLLQAHNQRQCTPQLPDQEVARIATNVSRYEYVPPLDLSEWGKARDDAPEIPEGGDLAVSLFDFISNPPVAPAPLIHGVIDVGTGVLIGGQPNVGKSWIVMDMALAIASGQSWLSRYTTEQGGVLMIDEEGTPYGQYERFQMLLDGRDYLSAVGLPMHVAIGSGIRLDSDVGVTRIRRMLERYRPGLVVMDSLVRMHAGDENNAQSMATFFAVTKDLMRTYETTFLFTHHVRKPSLESADPGDLLRGSTEIRAWPDTIFVAIPGQDSQEVVLHHVKARYGPRANPFVVRMQIDDETKTARLAHCGEAEKEDRTAIGQQNRILKAIVDIDEETGNPPDVEQIAGHLGVTPRTVREHLTVLVKAGALDGTHSKNGTGRPRMVYTIRGTT